MAMICANDDNQLLSNYRQLSANFRQIIVNFPSNYRQFVKLLSNYCQTIVIVDIIVKLLSLSHANDNNLRK